MNFEQAFTKLLRHEGGYVNHPSDPGGETMWGVTVVVARKFGYAGSMRDFPQDLAKKVYRLTYWDSVRADELPEGIRYAVFDAAVNSGPGQSIRWLQRALGVADDGKLGPVTLQTCQQANADVLLSKMLAQRLLFMTNLSTWSSFGKGWARRIASLMES